jgi:hypothetical protein
LLVYWTCFQLKKSFHVHSSVLVGCLLPCSHTINLTCTVFLIYTTWYITNFFWCGVDRLHIIEVFNGQLYSRNFTIKRKEKAFGTP